MNFIKSLLGKKLTATPLWNIKPQEQRPATKTRSASFAEPPAQEQAPKEPNPFLDDAMLDTMTLETAAGPDDNPYATHTWESNPENDTRKMRTVQIGAKTEKKPGSEFNPYDTGSMRRGWKKQ